MRIIKQIGFIIIAIGIILGLYQAYLLILNYLYNIFGIVELIGTIRLYVLFTMLIGFFLIIMGGVLEKYISRKKDLEFIEEPEKGSSRKRGYIISAIIGATIIIALSILISSYSDFYVPHEIRVWVDLLSIFAIVWFATSLPLYVDKINKDTLEIHLFGLHIHETFLGILFMITGFLFIFHHIIPFDFVLGAYYLIIGAFLMGRDIEDLRQFKIIERIK